MAFSFKFPSFVFKKTLEAFKTFKTKLKEPIFVEKQTR